MIDLKFGSVGGDRLEWIETGLEKLGSFEARVDRLWWIAAAMAGVAVAILLPRLVPQQSQPQHPYPRYAEHAEI
jgi:hypothetical protein